MFCLCILRVLFVCSALSLLFTFLQPAHCPPACVSLAKARNRRCAASVVPDQHKTRKIHAQNTQLRLDYWFDYVFGIDLRRNNVVINVISAFLRSFQRQFACFA